MTIGNIYKIGKNERRQLFRLPSDFVQEMGFEPIENLLYVTYIYAKTKNAVTNRDQLFGFREEILQFSGFFYPVSFSYVYIDLPHGRYI